MVQETEQPQPSTGHLIYPMHFGERIMWSIRFALSSFWYTMGLYLAVAASMALVFFLTFVMLFSTSSLSLDTLRNLHAPAEWVEPAGAGSVLIVLGALIVLLMLVAWYSVMFYRLPVLYLERGQRPPIRTLLLEAWSRVPDMSNTMGVVFSLPLLVAALVYGVLYLTGRLTPVTGGAGGVLVGLITIVSFIGLVLAGPVAANEPVSFWVAIRRGWALSRGRRWSLVGYMVVMPLVMAAILIGIRLLGWVIGSLIPFLETPIEVIYGLSVALLQVIYAVALVAGITVYYLESRIFLEGWEPAWRGALKPDWPRNGPPAPLIAARGKQGWRDFALLNGAMFGLMWWGVLTVGGKMMPGVARYRVEPTPASHRANAASDPVRWRDPQSTGSDGRKASGSITLTTGQFFDMGAKATVWIAPRINWKHPSLPSVVSPSGLLTIEIKSVRSRTGAEWYDAQAGTESRFFWDVSLEPTANGYKGVRQVHLRAGASEKGLDRIEGVVHWREPETIQPVRLTTGNTGQKFTLGSNTITVHAFDQRHIELAGPSGFQRDMLGVVGEQANGDVTVSRSTSASNGQVSYGFQSPITSVTLYYGRKYSEHHWPFTLRPGQPVVLKSGQPAAVATRSDSDPVVTPSSPLQSVATPGRSANPSASEPVHGEAEPHFDLSDASGLQRMRQWVYREVRAGHCAKAIPWLDRLILRAGNDAWARYARGACYQAAGRGRVAEDDIVYACGHGYPEACDLLQ